jgi:hypothetical protein
VLQVLKVLVLVVLTVRLCSHHWHL